MILYHPCPGCRAQARIRSSASTPQDLERERGSWFIATCSDCGQAFDVDPMHTRAKPNPLKVVFGLAFSLVLFAVIWSMGFIAWVAVAPVLIMFYLDADSVRAYNSLSKRKWG